MTHIAPVDTVTEAPPGGDLGRTDPGLRRSWRGMGPLDLAVMVLAILVMVLFVVLPLVYLAYGAVQDTSPTRGETTWSLRSLTVVYTTTTYLPEIVNTLQIAVFVTVFSIAIGTVLAWTVARTDTPARGFLEIMALAPLLFAPFVGATAWIALAAPQSGLLNALLWPLADGPIFNIYSRTGVILVMTLYYTPYAYLFSAASFRGMDPSLEEAARMSGASNLHCLRRITIPLVMPSIAAAALLIFVLSSESFSIPGLIGRPANFTNLPYAIYRQIRTAPPDWPMAAALGTLLVWVTLLGMWLYRRLTRASKRYVTISGRGYRPARLKIGRLKWVTLSLGIAYALLANFLPYGALLLGSFLRYLPGRALALDQLTLANYHFLAGRNFMTAAQNTLLLSTLTPTVIVLLAVALSFIVLRTRMPGRGVIDTVGTLPLAVPGIVFGIGVLWAYFRNPLPIYGTVFLIAFAYIGRYLPQGLRIAGSSLLQIDRELEDSARIHGASNIQAVRRVTLPLLKGPMLYAWLLVFMLVTREISAAIVLYGPNSLIMSVLIWDLMEAGRVTTAYAVGIVQSVFMLAVVLGARWLFGVDIVRHRT